MLSNPHPNIKVTTISIQAIAVNTTIFGLMISQILYLTNLTLLMLYLSVSGCTRSVRSVAPAPGSGASARSDAWLGQQTALEAYRNQGVIFFASGEAPHWVLTIDQSEGIVFRSEESKDSIITATSDRMLPRDARGEVYVSEVESGRIIITLVPDSCHSKEHSATMPYRLNIIRDGDPRGFREYSGCGLYLNNPALHDIWALTSWTGSSGEKVDVRGEKPRIEINMQNNTFFGYSGCSDIQGSLEPKGKSMVFHRTNEIPDACSAEYAREFERLFLFNEFEVLLSGLELRLTAEGQTLVFRKAD